MLAAVYEFTALQEQQERANYERLRLLAFFNVKPQYGKDLKQPTDLIVYDWEREILAAREKAKAEAEQRGNEILAKWKKADETNSWKRTEINQIDLPKILKSSNG